MNLSEMIVLFVVELYFDCCFGCFYFLKVVSTCLPSTKSSVVFVFVFVFVVVIFKVISTCLPSTSGSGQSGKRMGMSENLTVKVLGW